MIAAPEAYPMPTTTRGRRRTDNADKLAQLAKAPAGSSVLITNCNYNRFSTMAARYLGKGKYVSEAVDGGIRVWLKLASPD